MSCDGCRGCHGRARAGRGGRAPPAPPSRPGSACRRGRARGRGRPDRRWRRGLLRRDDRQDLRRGARDDGRHGGCVHDHEAAYLSLWGQETHWRISTPTMRALSLRVQAAFPSGSRPLAAGLRGERWPSCGRAPFSSNEPRAPPAVASDGRGARWKRRAGRGVSRPWAPAGAPRTDVMRRG
jgi:hypothetical protein